MGNKRYITLALALSLLVLDRQNALAQSPVDRSVLRQDSLFRAAHPADLFHWRDFFTGQALTLNPAAMPAAYSPGTGSALLLRARQLRNNAAGTSGDPLPAFRGAISARLTGLENLAPGTVLPRNPLAAGQASYGRLLRDGKSLLTLPATGNPLKTLWTRDTSLFRLPGISPTLPQASQLTAKLSGLQGQLAGGPGKAFAFKVPDGAQAPFKAMDDAISQHFKTLKHPALSANLSVENDLRYNPAQFSIIPASKFQEVLGVRGTLLVAGVPLSLNLSNNQAAFNGQNPLGSSLFKFGFNPAAYAGNLKNELQQYTDLKNNAFHGFNFTDYVRQTITEQVHSLQGSLPDLKKLPLYHLLDNPADLQGLLKLSDNRLREKLQAIAAEKSELAGAAQGGSGTLSAAEKQLSRLRADSVAEVLIAVRKQLTAKGLDPARLALLESYLLGKGSPEFLSSEAAAALSEKRPHNSWQSAFGKLKDLRIGSFGTTLPGAGEGEQSKLMNGANITVKMSGYPVTVGFGTLKDVNSLKDAGYQNSVYNFPTSVSYVGAQLRNNWLGNVRVSVMGSFSGQSAFIPYGQPGLHSNAVNFTVGKTLNLDRFGRLDVDVSKSTTLFNNNYQLGNEALLQQKAGANYSLTNDLFTSMSVGFRHALSIRELGASDNVYFTYSGLGYQNPANNGYSGAAMKFGGDLRKTFYQNRLSLDLRSDFSNTPLSYQSADKWKNYQVQLTGNYKLTRTLNFSLKYLENGVIKKSDSASISVYNARKLELVASNSYKVGSNYTTIRASVAGQMFRNTYVTSAAGNLLSLNYLQSMVFRTSSITYMFFYNKNLSRSTLLGDMLTSDLAYQYPLSKQVQLTSGATYLNNGRIADQLGIKQGIQVLAGRHFDAGASIDLMKNLITPQYDDLFPSVRAELTFKYYFKTE
ncbi:TonB-dependent receptor [Mucilaginibacter ginsenosidivorans]|uniref:TonB-dependent receptor n=1 Tax=Mucilaginibacter ginsenosidivorans TaxID=398053 RepID=A0A5B8UU19_9SPHI|nr:hypothetical protein [Mucilaginibacter ginsenosidivorans]QEC62544.1 hypothetical protein FRZ54_08055 [Mucilaginibacter ginsenosidivorans]